MSPSLKIPLAIVVGGIIIAVAVYISTPKPPVVVGNPALVRPIGAADHILGNPAASVVIIEYSDFDCEFCKAFNATLHQVIANSGVNGKVAWVFRQFPLTEIHPNALLHARATECAAQVGGNDAFWKFAEELYAAQPADPSSYGVIAKKAGISSNDFATCYAGAASTMDARIMADRQNALDMGADGTPYSLIVVAGKVPVVMSGAYPYDAVQQLLDEALAR